MRQLGALWTQERQVAEQTERARQLELVEKRRGACAPDDELDYGLQRARRGGPIRIILRMLSTSLKPWLLEGRE